MGNANFKNLTLFFVKQLHTKGQINIKDCVQAMIDAGEKYMASEGSYTDAPTLSEACMFILGQWDNVVEACEITDEQTKVYEQWHGGNDVYPAGWDFDEISIFYSINWRFTKEAREKYPDIPLLESFIS